MIAAIIVMGFVVAALLLFVIMLSSMIGNLNKQLELIDKEQHTQNNEIMVLLRKQMQHQEMLLQHIEILKYLIDQDPKMRAHKILFQGPIGEA